MPSHHTKHTVLAALCATFLALTPTARSSATPPPSEPVASATEPGRYLRIARTDRDERVALEVAVRKLEPRTGAGPAIWLVGAAHIGSPDYYKALQQFLDDQALVLYEGVGRPPFMDEIAADEGDETRALRTRSALGFTAGLLEWYRGKFGAWPASLALLRQAVREHKRAMAKPLGRALSDGWGRPVRYARTAGSAALTSFGADGLADGDGAAADITVEAHSQAEDEPEGLQTTLARALGLVFQLDGIDYDRENFVNSDLSLHELSARFSDDAAGEPSRFARVLSLLQGEGFISGIVRFGLNVLSLSPRFRETTKLVLIEVLGELGDRLEELPQLSPADRQVLSVLIRDRNKVVLQDIRARISKARPPTSIAVFYGAAHLKDMEQRIVRDLSYRPTEQFWLTAFEVHPARAGLTPGDLQLVRRMVQSQLKPAREAEQR